MEKLMFDQGNLFLEILFNDEKMLEKEKLIEITSIKHHINTWGLSTNNWLNENFFVKLKNLENIDFSDTIKLEPRSDLCLSISNILQSLCN
jgi:hypothetical protein